MIIFVRRTLIVIAAIFAIVLVQFLNPVSRAELGVNDRETACATPAFPNFNLEFGTNNKPNPNNERVSNEFLPYAVASLNAYRGNRTFVLTQYDEGWDQLDTLKDGNSRTTVERI